MTPSCLDINVKYMLSLLVYYQFCTTDVTTSPDAINSESVTQDMYRMQVTINKYTTFDTSDQRI